MFTDKIPTEPGLYNHRWVDSLGNMKQQVLFVGWVDWSKEKGQGLEKPPLAVKMKCCKPEENLHADRLTPKDWGGWWQKAI